MVHTMSLGPFEDPRYACNDVDSINNDQDEMGELVDIKENFRSWKKSEGHGGCVAYTTSSREPFKNVDFTSKWNVDQPCLHAKATTSLIDSNLIIDAYTSE